MNGEAEPHALYAKRVRDKVSGDGMTPPELRTGAMHRATGGPPIDELYDAVARRIGIAAYDVTDAQVAAVRAAAGREQLLDAAAVATVFNVITRYADALDFTIPTDDEFRQAAKMLLKRGYA